MNKYLRRPSSARTVLTTQNQQAAAPKTAYSSTPCDTMVTCAGLPKLSVLSSRSSMASSRRASSSSTDVGSPFAARLDRSRRTSSSSVEPDTWARAAAKRVRFSDDVTSVRSDILDSTRDGSTDSSSRASVGVLGLDPVAKPAAKPVRFVGDIHSNLLLAQMLGNFSLDSPHAAAALDAVFRRQDKEALERHQRYAAASNSSSSSTKWTIKAVHADSDRTSSKSQASSKRKAVLKQLAKLPSRLRSKAQKL